MSAPWQAIKARLIADGQMSEQDVTRTPKARHCRDCGRSVIAAITDLGFEVAVEPTPTTPAGELDVLMRGGETYALLEHGELVWRSRHRIAYRDADQEPTHAGHLCGKAPPEVNPNHRPRAKPRTNFDGPIPY